MKCCSGLLACELPLDGGLVLIDAAVPGASLFAQGGDIFDPSFAEALAAEHADLHLRLIQPTSMFGGVVHREAVPQPGPGGVSEPFHQRLRRVRGEVVHDQVDGVGCGIAGGDLQQVIGELG